MVGGYGLMRVIGVVNSKRDRDFLDKFWILFWDFMLKIFVLESDIIRYVFIDYYKCCVKKWWG